MSVFQDVVDSASQFLSGIQAQNPQGFQGNKIHLKAGNGGGFTNSPLYNAGVFTGAVGQLAAPEEEAPVDALNLARQAFAHHLAAATGDVTRTFKPDEIDTAIQALKGQQPTGDHYTDEAIRMANIIHGANSGAVVNSPIGGGLLGGK